jgi:hypothetical protein
MFNIRGTKAAGCVRFFGRRRVPSRPHVDIRPGPAGAKRIERRQSHGPRADPGRAGDAGRSKLQVTVEVRQLAPSESESDWPGDCRAERLLRRQASWADARRRLASILSRFEARDRVMVDAHDNLKKRVTGRNDLLSAGNVVRCQWKFFRSFNSL